MSLHRAVLLPAKQTEKNGDDDFHIQTMKESAFGVLPLIYLCFLHFVPRLLIVLA